MVSHRLSICLSVPLAVLLVAGSLRAAGTVRSGPQVGERVPGSFVPLNVTGPDAGQKSCLYCRYGTRPVVMVFARELNPQTINLLKRLEAATAAHADDSLGACVVFCNDSPDLPAQLAETAKQNNVKQVILATYAVAGPARYKIATDSDITVLLYTHCSVKANHAFKKGDTSDSAVDAILGDIKTILSHE